MFKNGLKVWFIKTYVGLWQRMYTVSIVQHKRKTFFIILPLLIILSSFVRPYIQTLLAPHLNEISIIENFESLLLTLGGALIGAAAISFSFILFAMQVNVERLPYGLFRKFSSDPKLLTMVITTFLIAICIACLSLYISTAFITEILLFSFWGIVLIFVLFYETYRRALHLINNNSQLNIVVVDAVKQMKMWVKRSKRAKPLLLMNAGEIDPLIKMDIAHNLYLITNPQWCASAREAVKISSSFFNQSAKKEDYEGSVAALNAIIAINIEYISAKGNTFTAQNPFIDNPMSTDTFFTDTLEYLRKALRAMVLKGDEQLIEQLFRTYQSLIMLYLNIDYNDQTSGKTHANIAMRYLTDGIQSIATSGLIEVHSEGVRCLGRCARYMIGRNRPEFISSPTDQIVKTGLLGLKDENHRPITMFAVTELSTITLLMMQSKDVNMRHAFKDIRANIQNLSMLFLLLPDGHLTHNHSTYLAPYYSSTSNDSFKAKFRDLVNLLLNISADDADAKVVIRNISEWSDQLYISLKELLLKAVEQRTSFVLDIVLWIRDTSNALIATSCSDACDDNVRDKLVKNAVYLLLTLTWLPAKEDDVSFLCSYRFEEYLFEAALDGRLRSNDEYIEAAEDALLNFGFKVGQFESGDNAFEQSLYGICILAILNDNIEQSVQKISKNINQSTNISSDTKNLIATRMIKTIDNLGWSNSGYSTIERFLEKVDKGTLENLLKRVASLLVEGNTKIKSLKKAPDN